MLVSVMAIVARNISEDLIIISVSQVLCKFVQCAIVVVVNMYSMAH